MNKDTKLAALAAMAEGGKTHTAVCPKCGHTFQMPNKDYEEDDVEDDEDEDEYED